MHSRTVPQVKGNSDHAEYVERHVPVEQQPVCHNSINIRIPFHHNLTSGCRRYASGPEILEVNDDENQYDSTQHTIFRDDQIDDLALLLRSLPGRALRIFHG